MRSLGDEMRAATSAQARFHCIGRLARAWHGSTPRGYEPSDLSAAEARLGFSLPKTVRYWFESFALTEGIAFMQNHIVQPCEWRLVDGRLMFGEENQGNWRSLVDLEGDDPPVFAVDQHPGRLSSAFSVHALQTALFETIMSSGAGTNGPGRHGAEPWARAFFGEPVVEPWDHAGPGPGAFYLGDPGLAFLQGESLEPWCFFALVDDDALLAEVEQTAPVDWVVAPTE